MLSEPIEVTDSVTGSKSFLPASLVYFPRDQWALIGWDDVAMVFARRNEFPTDVIDSIEWHLVPDARTARWVFSGGRPVGWEIERARREIGESRRLSEMIRLIEKR